MPRSREILLPWDRQPQEAVGIDWSDPINSGSVFLWSAANPNVEAITGRLVTTNNTTGVVDQYGRSVRSATGQTNLEWNSEFFKTSDGAGTGDFSALIVANPAASGSGAVQHIFSHKNDAGGSPFGQFVFAAHMNPSSGTYASGNATFFTFASTSVGVASAGATDGEMHVWGIRRRGNDHYLFKDGVQLATTNNFARDVVQTTTRYTAIGSRGNGTTEGYDRDVAFVQGWDRALTDAEILERSRSILSVYRAFASQTIWVPVSAGAPSGISATLTQTLANATVSAASTLALKGAVSQTLANATTTATGTLALKGTTTQTLADATLAATGSLQVAGSGVLAATLADASAAATGTVALKATTAQTLDAATVSATGTVAVTGTLTKTLADASLAATSTLALKAATSQTLADATLSAAGVLAVAGSGTLAQTLADVAITSAGTVALKSVASVTLADTALAGTAALALKGTASKTLDDATVSAQGTAQTVTTGTLSTTLDAATLSATAKLAISANAAPTLADAAVSASATTTYLDLTAIVTQTLGNVTSTATGAVLIKGSATVTLDDCAIVASNVPTVFTDTEWWLYVVAADDLSYAVTADSLSYRTGV